MQPVLHLPHCQPQTLSIRHPSHFLHPALFLLLGRCQPLLYIQHNMLLHPNSFLFPLRWFPLWHLPHVLHLPVSLLTYPSFSRRNFLGMFTLTLLALSVCSGVTSTLSTSSPLPCPRVFPCTVSNGRQLFWVNLISPGLMQSACLLSASAILNWPTSCIAKWPGFTNIRTRPSVHTMTGLPGS